MRVLYSVTSKYGWSRPRFTIALVAVVAVAALGTASSTRGDSSPPTVVRPSASSEADATPPVTPPPDCVPDDNGNCIRPTVWITASPASVAYGGTSTLSWASSNSSYCYISGSGLDGYVQLSGSWTTNALYSNTTFNITCSDYSTSASSSVTITLNPTTVWITASPANVAYGGTSTVSWGSSSSAYCYIGGGGLDGYVQLSGSWSTNPLYSNTTFNITCSNYSTSASSSVTVSVDTPPPTVTASADPGAVPYGSYTNITWQSTNADYCTVGSDTVGSNGSYRLEPILATRQVPVTCYGSGGSSTAYVTVYYDGTPILATGTLKDANGNPVVGNVRLFVEPDLSNTGDSGSATQIASVLSDANGNFGVALDPNNPTLQAAMSANNGWVNLEADVFSSNYEGVSEIQRRWASGMWTDALEGMPATTPAPLSFTLADGVDNVRTLASVDSVSSTGTFSATDSPVTSQNKNTVVGEFHDVQDETGTFKYMTSSTTSYDVRVSYDLTTGKWGSAGMAHFSKSSSVLNSSFVNFQASNGYLMVVPIKWVLVKEEIACWSLCLKGPGWHTTRYKWTPVAILQAVIKGSNISNLDHQCGTTWYMNKTSGTSRWSGQSTKFTAGVTLSYNGFGVSVGTQSGFDQGHGWEVKTGSKYGAYHYCGPGGVAPGPASRNFFGTPTGP
jgi:hypothetical protein